MYLVLEEGKGPLKEENRFYTGLTAKIYRDGDVLYKIYEKQKPYRESALDQLIQNTELCKVGILPEGKVKTESGKYGIVMPYLDHSRTFSQLLKEQEISTDEYLTKMIILSNNLKQINGHQIHFSDLHRKNILIDTNGYPWYIDFDDAVVGKDTSYHICSVSCRFHDVNNKSHIYRDNLIRFGNLDQECLMIMLLNYVLNDRIETYSRDAFERLVNRLDNYFSRDFVKAVAALKASDVEVVPYRYYVGDYLQKYSNDYKMCRLLRREYGLYTRRSHRGIKVKSETDTAQNRYK